MENMEERQVEMWKDMENMEESQVEYWNDMENMEDFCVSHNYTQKRPPPPLPSFPHATTMGLFCYRNF